jgi:hypothetical protein
MWVAPTPEAHGGLRLVVFAMCHRPRASTESLIDQRVGAGNACGRATPGPPLAGGPAGTLWKLEPHP